jgi:hypothetical protein
VVFTFARVKEPGNLTGKRQVEGLELADVPGPDTLLKSRETPQTLLFAKQSGPFDR